MNKKEF